MTADTLSHHPLPAHGGAPSARADDLAGQTDYARYLIDVTVTILKSIQLDLASKLGGGPKFGQWAELDLIHFVSAVFRHSRVSYSVLLTGLLYLLRFRHYFASRPMPRPLPCATANVILLVFISSLVLSNKYLHDRHSSNLTWTSYTGFPLEDINRGEIFFLQVIQHELLVDQSSFQKWLSILFQPKNLSHYYRTSAAADLQRVPDVSARRFAPPTPIDSYRRPEQAFMGYYCAFSAQ